MATVTKTIGILNDDVSGLNAEVQIDYDDGTLRITVVRVINPTSRPVLITATRISNGRTYSNTFPAGQTTFISIPQSPPADRLAVTIDARGRVDGVEYTTAWVL